MFALPHIDTVTNPWNSVNATGLRKQELLSSRFYLLGSQAPPAADEVQHEASMKRTILLHARLFLLKSTTFDGSVFLQTHG